ncbi:MAG: NAD(P)H-hydrate dehydratase [SAR324 cluster bacterium]|nr:NAD(P)H-hydrate dehydratase [SAR324 cluster bacterium]
MRLANNKIMQQMDHRAINKIKIPSMVLMENAARSVFEAIHPLLELESKVFIFVGSGNNGGDGYGLARICKNHGWEVAVVAMAQAASPDCKKMAKIYQSFGQILDFESFQAADPEITQRDIVVDAIFGTGLEREIEGELVENMKWIDQLGGVKIAIDLPSGVNGSTGDQMGASIRADMTIGLAQPKVGHYLYPGKALRGGLVVKPVSIPEVYESSDPNYQLINDELVLGMFKPLNTTTYKHEQGHLALLCGAAGTLGAGLLAARASLTSGSGLATLALPSELQSAAVHEAPEVMSHPREKLGPKWFAHFNAVVAGCGVGRKKVDWKKYFAWFKKLDIPLVLDADAFHGLSTLKGLNMEKLVLTPHLGEFLAFTKNESPKDNATRIAQGLEFVKKWPCTLILKGAPTIIFTADGRIFINETGNAGLATAGSGDVLAGFVGGLLAQGYQPEEASLLGVWLHGLAADIYCERAAPESLTAVSLIDCLGPAMAQLQDELG